MNLRRIFGAVLISLPFIIYISMLTMRVIEEHGVRDGLINMGVTLGVMITVVFVLTYGVYLMQD